MALTHVRSGSSRGRAGVLTLFLAVMLLAALTGTAHAAPITVQIPLGGIFISDNGPGDLNPLDGIITFSEVVDDSVASGGHGAGIRRFEGDAIYHPGVPIAGGATGFGLTLTNFVATSLEAPTNLVPPCFIGVPFDQDPLCTDNGRPLTTFGQMDVFVQAQFSPGIPAASLGRVTAHLAGEFLTDAGRVYISDLASWAGTPTVSAGHIGFGDNPDTPLVGIAPFAFPDITSPVASGALGLETVTGQLLTFYVPPDGVGQLRLPTSASAIVTAVPEPAVTGLWLIGAAAGAVVRRRRGPRAGQPHP